MATKVQEFVLVQRSRGLRFYDGHRKEAKMDAPQLDDPEMPLADLMTHWPQTIPVFVRHKMLCVGCLVSPFHTVADACTEYHLNQDAFMAELNTAVAAYA